MSYLVIMVLSNNVSKGSNENIGYCFFESQEVGSNFPSPISQLF